MSRIPGEGILSLGGAASMLVLLAAGDWRTTDEVAAAIGESRNYAVTGLSDLHARGLVERERRKGRMFSWRPTESGKAWRIDPLDEKMLRGKRMMRGVLEAVLGSTRPLP